MPPARRSARSSRPPGTGGSGTGYGHRTTESASTLSFPPHVLRDYALVADGERGALFGPRGDIAWLCAPGWGDGAVLSGLLGGPGTYALTPPGRHVWGGRYEEGSLVWRNRWVSQDQVVECREALALPADPRTLVLLRRVGSADGEALVDVSLDLRADYGRAPSREVARDAGGVWTGRTGALRWRWSGAAEARPDADGVLRLRLRVPPGGSHDLVLEVGAGELGTPVVAREAWTTTEAAWHDAVPPLQDAVAVRDARHAMAVLHGMTTATGALVAAATTSLPERVEEGRSYDYRYAWVRDQSYAGLALAAAGAPPLLDRHVGFVVARLLGEGEAMRPFSTPDGSPVDGEGALPLPGYPGGRAVRGNSATGQRQLDVVGEALQLLATAACLDRLDTDGRRAAQVAADVVERHWQEPESGLWELDARWWTQSRLTCVAALRTLARAEGGPDAGRHLALADAITAETSRRCVGDGGFWQRSPDLPGTDASLVVPAVRGALPADDPRTVATIAEVHRSLVQEGYVYRFAQDSRPLGQAEGAFLLCGFQLALAEHQQGNTVQAFRLFERNRAAAGAPGLFTEEFDVGTRQLRGNLPQAFVHAALLETAVALAR